VRVSVWVKLLGVHLRQTNRQAGESDGKRSIRETQSGTQHYIGATRGTGTHPLQRREQPGVALALHE